MVTVGLEFGWQENTIVWVVFLDLEAFILGHGFKLHCTLDGLIRGVQVLWKIEYFTTGMVNKQTSACIA